MLDAFVDAGAIVNIERAIGRPRWHGVDKDGRNLLGIKALEKKLFAAEGHDGDAVHLAFEHSSGATLHLVRVVTRRTDQDLVAPADGYLLKLVNELREERVGDLGDD